MQVPNITITSYNIHKGKSALNRTIQIKEMASALKNLNSDIVFLQEVQGLNLTEKLTPQLHFKPHNKILANYLNYYDSYGRNANFNLKHHGNAILSRTPIHNDINFNLTINKFEQRGLLHCKITPPGWQENIECLCVHLNLMEQDREKQYLKIFDYIEQHIDSKKPIILAGDFNDWRYKSQQWLEQLDFSEVFLSHLGSHPKTFPAKLPMLSLDRIYIRNLEIIDTVIHHEMPWKSLSDHIPLTATIVPKAPL